MNTKKNSFARAFGALIPLTLLALLLSALIVSLANDIYAFVKKDSESTLYLSEPCSLDELSEMMKDLGIVKNPNIFKLYVISKGKRETVEAFSGEVKLNSNLSYRQILYELQNAQKS